MSWSSLDDDLTSDLEGDFEQDDLSDGQYRRIFTTIKIESLPPRQAKRYLFLILLFMGAVLLHQYVYPVWRENGLNDARNASALNVVRRLALAQENHYADEGRYAEDMAALDPYFILKRGVSIQLISGDHSAWSGYVFHKKSPVKYLYESDNGGFIGGFDRKTGDRIAE